MDVRDAAAEYRIEPAPDVAADDVPAGYKRTEVGVIPSDWNDPTIESILDEISMGPFGSDIKVSNFTSHGVPVLNGANVAGERLEDAFEHFVTPVKARSLKKAVARRGDVVVTHRGTIGQIAFVPKDSEFEQYVISQSQFRAHFHDQVVDPAWLVRYFHSEAGARSLLEGKGHTGVPAIARPTTTFRALRIPLPALDEQEAIAEALSDADALIESLQQLIAKRRAIKQGAMQALLTGRQRLPGFSGEWKVTQLAELAAFHKGKGLPKSAITDSGTLPCVHYGELFTRLPETIRETRSRTNWAGDSFRSVANDVLMPTSDVTPRGLAKASCIAASNVIIGGDVLVIRADPNVLLGTFLSYVIRNSVAEVLQLVTGTTVFHLYASDMRKFEMTLPSIEEQRAIVGVLDDMDATIDALEVRLAKTRALKAGMMQQLLTGRIRLAPTEQAHA